MIKKVFGMIGLAAWPENVKDKVIMGEIVSI
jgi:hypothetical protein